MAHPDPSDAYYRSMHGRWTCGFTFAITDWAAFRASPMGWLDRLRVISMAAIPRVLGPLAMTTTVDYPASAARGEVLHTTRVAKWGATLFRSVEVIALQPDGRRATMRGDQWLWPFPWPSRDFGEGTVVVDEAAIGARYRFGWFGTEMDQQTRVVPEGLEIVQQTAWSRSVLLLRRVRP